MKLLKNIFVLTVTLGANISLLTNTNSQSPISLADANVTPIGNVVTVAKQNGDFSDPATAVESINGASEENPYVVFVAPGVYSISGQLRMKPFVSIRGSGIGSSVIIGSSSASGNVASAESALIVGANGSNLSDVELINEPESGVGVGLFSSGATQSINRVKVIVTGGSIGFGIAGRNDAVLRVNDSIIDVSNKGSSAKGLDIFQSFLALSNSTVAVSTPGQFASGIVLNNVGPAGASIYSSNVSLPGTSSVRRGVSSNANTNNVIQVSDSLIEGSTLALSAQTTSRFFVSNTILEGQVNGTPTCSFVFLNDGTSLDENCLIP